jgi:hypothetical protein
MEQRVTRECEIHRMPSNNGMTVRGETHESTAKTLSEVELNEKKTERNEAEKAEAKKAQRVEESSV